MIPSLRQIAPETAQGILANLTLDMLPHPEEAQESGGRINPELKERILNELRVRLRLKRNDYSPRALGKLYGALSEEMSKLALRDVDLRAVKARLGQQGSLSPSQYKITFSDFFARFSEKSGISRTQVEDAVRKPDAVEHLRPEHFGFNAEHATSLFLKTHKPISADRELYHLLIVAMRSGDILRIRDAWRVYPSDVDLSTASTPLDVLRAFVETFGATFKLGGKEKNLFMYEKFPIPKQGEVFNIDPMQDKEKVHHGQAIGIYNEKTFEIVLSYQIDYTSFTESLRKHGLHVQAKPFKRQ